MESTRQTVLIIVGKGMFADQFFWRAAAACRQRVSARAKSPRPTCQIPCSLATWTADCSSLLGIVVYQSAPPDGSRLVEDRPLQRGAPVSRYRDPQVRQIHTQGFLMTRFGVVMLRPVLRRRPARAQ